MRRLALLVPFVLACSGGSSPNLASSSPEAQFLASMADAGVNCLHREPPPFHACLGLDAGAPCAVPDDDADAGSTAGVCKALRDGRLVCAGPDDDEDRADGGESHRDGGEMHGDAGTHDDFEHDGGMGSIWLRDGGLPPPIQAAIAACTGKAADDTCTVTFREHTINGACKVAPIGSALICAPLCSHR